MHALILKHNSECAGQTLQVQFDKGMVVSMLGPARSLDG